MRRSTVLPRVHSVIRPTTGCSSRPNSVEPARLDAGQVARGLDHRHLHAEADAEIGHLALAGEAGRRRSCPPSRARRSRRAPGCRARLPDAADRVLLLEDLGVEPFEPDPDVVGDAAVGQRLVERLVGVLQVRCTCRPPRSRHLAVRVADALDDVASQSPGRGPRSRPHAELLADLGRRGPLVIGQRHLVDRVDVRSPGSPLRRARCRTARSCGARPRSGSRARQRQSRMSGWMPISRSSLTECWVGLVFSSPAEAM